jgi:hypothetical protein
MPGTVLPASKQWRVRRAGCRSRVDVRERTAGFAQIGLG